LGQQCTKYFKSVLVISHMQNDLKYLVHCWPNVST
jgi:hypothetical protein